MTFVANHDLLNSFFKGVFMYPARLTRPGVSRFINGRTFFILLGFTGLFLLSVLGITGIAEAATTTGAALKPAFDALNDIAGGYGKQLLVLIGFIVVALGFWAVTAGALIVKFVGYIIFLSVALGAAVTLSGAVI
jgi:hypothetical protein